MKKRNVMTACILLIAAPVFTPANAADDNTFAVFGMVSDFDPEQTGAGGGIAVDWEWTDTVFITSQVFVAAADDVDRGRILLGGEWRDRRGGVVGYVGLQGGADVYDTAAGSEEDSFLRAYYDLGWRVFGESELRLGIGYDAKTDIVDRMTALRVAWTTSTDNGMSFFVRGELYEEEKNVFAGVSWGY